MKSVLFTQRVEVVASYNERRDCADQRIADFLSVCGLLPIPVPNNPKTALSIANKIHPVGIILVGGNSLVKYGGNAPERDRTDSSLIDYAVSKKLPLYGFCRGMQSILDYFGCCLVKVDNHVAVRHSIYENNGTNVVNSYHNYGCIQLVGSCLQVLSRSNDGVIESVRHVTLPILGTMWHPEREYPFRECDIVMVKNLMKI